MAQTSSVAYNFVVAERDQRFLLSPDMRDWLPEDHLAYFVDGLPYDLHVVPQTLDGLAEFVYVLARGQVGRAGG